ncbi:uncharacterized protein PG998_001100 [Apiospora kogelbergensis]|uniref:uncharacterized protein n=1 Tax=Apiospora kogelbergensis TaxID=1337665 RepID=UPI00312D459B
MGSTDAATSMPYWHVNVPESEREADCPGFLRDLSAKDQGIISTPDDQYHTLTWAEVRDIVATNRLDRFQRVPSDLRRYLAYNWQLRRDHGSIMNFVLNQRLRWAMPITPKGAPFELPEDDIKTLWNDWPYGLDKRIVHIVVWTKFDLEEDPQTTDLTDAARREINHYVDKVFGSRLPAENYIWFKNWSSLKSVHAVEHFHVMLFDPDPAFIDEITHGDVPLCRKV